MSLLKRPHAIHRDFAIECVRRCRCANGGYGANTGHDAHILYTLSAVQILALCDAVDRLDVGEVAGYIASLQQPDGSFSGDEFGDDDTRQVRLRLFLFSILMPRARGPYLRVSCLHRTLFTPTQLLAPHVVCSAAAGALSAPTSNACC